MSRMALKEQIFVSKNLQFTLFFLVQGICGFWPVQFIVDVHCALQDVCRIPNCLLSFPEHCRFERAFPAALQQEGGAGVDDVEGTWEVKEHDCHSAALLLQVEVCSVH